MQYVLDPSYLNWLEDYIHIYEYVSYRWIVDTLSAIPFYWQLWLDENANTHGLNLRHRYSMATGAMTVETPCASLLEVMIACAIINEETCHYNRDFDGSYRWFWQEMANVGFINCSDEREVYAVAERLLSRAYDSDGSGSMTGPLINPKEDVRSMPFIQQIQVWDMRQFIE